METCVLIPSEFSLVLTSSGAKVRETDHRGKLCDVGVSVRSNQRISRGSRFLPLQGTIRLDKIECYGHLDEDDIRHRFGCYDEVQEIDSCKIRHCNWVRFLRYSPTFSSEVNLLGSLVKGEPVYESIRTIAANTELVVYYEDSDEFSKSPLSLLTSRTSTVAFYRHAMGMILEDTPLDLSKSLLCSQTPITLTCKTEVLPSTPSPALPSPLGGEPDKRRSFSSDSLSLGDESTTVETPVATPRKARERTLLPCEVCGKAFDRPSLLRRHMRTHTGEKPHVCDVCGKGFSTSSSLNTHRRIHSGEKPHQCHVCGKRFTASSNLYYHRMTHSKEKPHKCSLCSKSFPTPGDLKSHMYVHNGSWPFKCHICNRGFSKQTNLKNHLFLHTGDKPHVCEHCHKRFALACNLRAHLKTHEGESQERCTQCGKSFSSSSGMVLHGYCQLCYQNSNGISLSKKSNPEEKAKSPPSPLLSNPADMKLLSLMASPENHTPMMLGVLDQVMMRYRDHEALLPASLASMRYLDGAPILSQRT